MVVDSAGCSGLGNLLDSEAARRGRRPPVMRGWTCTGEGPGFVFSGFRVPRIRAMESPGVPDILPQRAPLWGP